MKQDVLAWANGSPTAKRPSKETLNHEGLIALASGLDPYADTPAAYLAAYRALGIDIVNRVPAGNARRRVAPGQPQRVGDWARGHLGVYDTYTRVAYPYRGVDDFLDALRSDAFCYPFCYPALRVPVPHPLTPQSVAAAERRLGEAGMYYPMLYTTLFMWGVEELGWDVFLQAALLEETLFDERFLAPAFAATLALSQTLLAAESPFCFFHDDLCDARGPVMPPRWLAEHIYPRYRLLFAHVHSRGKKVIAVIDGNSNAVLPHLRACGADGVMPQSPQTSLPFALEVFRGGFVIGGVDTALLTFGAPQDVRRHVADIGKLTADEPGFAISSCGGLHGGIPLNNLRAYFAERAEWGFTPPALRAL